MGPTAISTYTGAAAAHMSARLIRCSRRMMHSSPQPRPSAAARSRSATCPAMTLTARSCRRRRSRPRTRITPTPTGRCGQRTPLSITCPASCASRSRRTRLLPARSRCCMPAPIARWISSKRRSITLAATRCRPIPLALDGPPHAPGGTLAMTGTYQLRIFIKNQASAQLFTEGLTTSQRRINLSAFPNYFPNSMTNSYAQLTVAQKSHDPDFQYAQVSSSYSWCSPHSTTPSRPARHGGHHDAAQVQFRWIPPTNQADQTAIAWPRRAQQTGS